MDTYQAALDTMEICEDDCVNWPVSENPSMSIDHLRDMMARWPADGSDTKKSRWLGWMQATAVACGYPRITLDTMKAINQTNNNDPDPVVSDDSAAMEFMYTNYKGVQRKRTATPVRFYLGSTEFHPDEQWLMRAYDHEKKDFRDFALEDCSFGWSPREKELHDEVLRQAAMLEERYADAKLISINDGVVQVGGSMIALIAEHLAQALLLREDAPTSNYLECRMNHPEIGDLTLTIQRCEGLTPHQLRAVSDAGLADVKSAIEPVIHWYQSDEHEERPLKDIITDIVQDLQDDRAAVISGANNLHKHGSLEPVSACAGRTPSPQSGE